MGRVNYVSPISGTHQNSVTQSLQTVAELIPDTTDFSVFVLSPQDHADLRSHFFTVGMKLEAVNMSEPSHVCPASVTKVRLPPQRSTPGTPKEELPPLQAGAVVSSLLSLMSWRETRPMAPLVMMGCRSGVL